MESLQAILDELAPTDARAKNIKPQEMVDNRYLDEMNKSGFMDQLWARSEGEFFNHEWTLARAMAGSKRSNHGIDR